MAKKKGDLSVSEVVDAARRIFDGVFKFIPNTMIEGAWDEENKKIK